MQMAKTSAMLGRLRQARLPYDFGVDASDDGGGVGFIRHAG